MSKQTIKFGKVRLARSDARKAYTFSHMGYRPTRRSGVYKIGA